MTQPSTSSLPDHYATLQVSENASPEVITAAYRSLARKYHPDTNPSPEANARMKSINVAYDVLSDQNKRAAYNLQRMAAKPASKPPAQAMPRTPPPPQQRPPATKPPQAQAVPRTPPPQQQSPAPKSQPKPPTAARPAPPAPSLFGSISSFLASPAFGTFIIAFIITLVILTVIAESLMLFELEWVIVPISALVGGVAAIVKSRRRA